MCHTGKLKIAAFGHTCYDFKEIINSNSQKYNSHHTKYPIQDLRHPNLNRKKGGEGGDSKDANIFFLLKIFFTKRVKAIKRETNIMVCGQEISSFVTVE